MFASINPFASVSFAQIESKGNVVVAAICSVNKLVLEMSSIDVIQCEQFDHESLACGILPSAVLEIEIGCIV